MIFAHRLTTTLLTTLLLVSCNSIPKITISIGEESNKVEAEPTNPNSSSISQLEEPATIESENLSTSAKDTETLTQSKSNSSSSCPATNISNSNRISLLTYDNGRQTFSCSGTTCSGIYQYEGAEGFDKLTNDFLFAAKEAVIGFKDGRCATFDTLTLLAGPMLQNFDDKEFELLVGNDSPTGEFESIGKFTLDSMSKTFNFEPQTGRYLKVKKLTRESFGDSSFKLQLWGALE